MTFCKLTDDMKNSLRNKLTDIREQVDYIVTGVDHGEGCLLCKVSDIKNLANDLEIMVSIYHFHSSLLPHVKGLDEIAKALAILSEKRYGALLAVEQTDSLEPFIHACHTTGAYIGANLSAPLLEVIFYPGSPLHDGSVIIRNGQIVSAGCVFPLSEQKYSKEGRKIGTRHRAALGLSERSDALVIVVSEETGQVSFAMRGVLHPIEMRLCENMFAKKIDTP